jgi:NAD+ synthase (glutamine-hydrolysing)
LLGLSGGIDSALVATIACDAIGAQNVYGVSMPSSYSSEHSKSDARELAERTGLRFATVPIGPMVRRSSTTSAHRPAENLQARGVTLIGLSTNVSFRDRQQVIAVGYSTIYGDMVAAMHR